MSRILITGATDGIGLETAKKLTSLGHEVIVHGRSPDKLAQVKSSLSVKTVKADFSNLSEVQSCAEEIKREYDSLNVLINNAGVFKTRQTRTEQGLDVRFVVNTIAPYLFTKKLLPMMNTDGRVLNLSSAAQASVDFKALVGQVELSDFEAYAQSKLAITMWSRYLGNELENKGPLVISVNPGSLLDTKMVKEGFGTSGNDINIGVNILVGLALEEKYKNSTGQYFDNDAGEFAPPQADGLDDKKTVTLIDHLNRLVEEK